MTMEKATTGLYLSGHPMDQYREAARRLERDGPNQLDPPRRPPLLLRLLGQFQDPMILVLLGYVLFRSTSMHRALEYFGAMFGLTGNAAADGAAATALKNHASALILCALASTPIACWIQKHTGRFGNSDAVKNAVCGVIFLAAVACIVSSSYNPFIYFAF